MEYLFGLAVLAGLYFIWEALRQAYKVIALLNDNFVNHTRSKLAQDIENINVTLIGVAADLEVMKLTQEEINERVEGVPAVVTECFSKWIRKSDTA